MTYNITLNRVLASAPEPVLRTELGTPASAG